MLRVYTTPNCSSCKKVKGFFDKYHIEYTEKNFFSTPLTREDVYKMLSYSENGFSDLIATRSKIIKENDIDIDKMKTSELIDFIIANPSILKRPIIISDMEMQIGYNDEDITLFVPDEVRNEVCGECLSDVECNFQDAIESIKKAGK